MPILIGGKEEEDETEDDEDAPQLPLRFVDTKTEDWAGFRLSKTYFCVRLSEREKSKFLSRPKRENLKIDSA